MPRGDGTGPAGMGPLTGRGAGFCNGYDAPGYANYTGFGRGFGRGFRRMFYAGAAPRWGRVGYPTYDIPYEPVVDEKKVLKEQEDFLEGQLEQVKKRLSSFKDDSE